MRPGTGDCEVTFKVNSRFDTEPGSSPEEMIGAAHAGCFSMALAFLLQQEGHEPKKISTQAEVTLKKDDDGWTIDSIVLTSKAEVPGIDREAFMRLANEAKAGCPVSRALSAVDIDLNPELDAS